MPNEIPVVFHSSSNYDYWGKFECLLENAKNYKTFFVEIEKQVTKIDKDCNESVVTISCTIKVIDSARFMPTSLSNLVDNLKEGIHKIKCKSCFLEYESDKDNLLKYKFCLGIKII